MENKVVVIAGGTRGIGRSLVDYYLKKGYRVATFSKNAAHVQSLKQASVGLGDIYVDTLDVNQPAACQDFIDRVIQKFGRIDCFYYNAGICLDKSFKKMTQNQWGEVLETNLLAAFTLTQAVFRQMSEQPGAKSIYFMTSLAGIEGVFGQANYSASKAGLIGFMKALALEGRRSQISVNCISPAALTEMTAPMVDFHQREAERTGEPFADYWKIGTSEQLAETLYRLDQKHQETGKIFSINGEKVRMYEEPIQRDYPL